MTGEATPAARDGVTLGGVSLSPETSPGEIAERLLGMPRDVEGLERRDVTTAADSATVVYLAGEDESQPQFGMAVVLVVPPSSDADAAIAQLHQTRWGDPADHTITETGDGSDGEPAYRAFWRVFPPGLFAIPNKPIYFLIWYRADDHHAYMVIGGTPVIRESITGALVRTLGQPAEVS